MDKRSFCLKIVFRLCKNVWYSVPLYVDVPLEAVSPFKELCHEFYQNSIKGTATKLSEK